jgi:hypothetical protein
MAGAGVTRFYLKNRNPQPTIDQSLLTGRISISGKGRDGASTLRSDATEDGLRRPRRVQRRNIWSEKGAH